MTNPHSARVLAAEARTRANDSTLNNERDRHLRSAAAWEVIADREERVKAARELRNQPPVA